MAYQFSSSLGVKHVLTINHTKIWAGGVRDIEDLNWDLMIRMYESEHDLEEYSSVTASEDAEGLFPESIWNVAPPPTLDILWPDFGKPTLDKEWWATLYHTIANWPKVGEGANARARDIVIFCIGGHGRTGTFLSILMGIHMKMTWSKKKQKKHDPVTVVRKLYRERAVETLGQIKYIEDILGINLDHVDPSGFSSYKSIPRVSTAVSENGYSVGPTVVENGTVHSVNASGVLTQTPIQEFIDKKYGLTEDPTDINYDSEKQAYYYDTPKSQGG